MIIKFNRVAFKASLLFFMLSAANQPLFVYAADNKEESFLSSKIMELCKSDKLKEVTEIAEPYYQIMASGDISNERIITLSAIAEAFRMTGQDTIARKYANKLGEMTKKSDNNELKALSNHKLGLFYKRQNRLSESGSLLKSALSNVEKTGNTGLEAAILNDLGNWYVAKGDSKNAIGLFRKSTDCARSVKNKSIEINGLTNLSRALYEEGKIEEASITAQNSSEAILEHYSPESIFASVAVMNLLLDCSDRSSNPVLISNLKKQANKQYQQLLSTIPNIKDKLALSYAYGGIGSFLEKSKKYQEASFYTNKAIFFGQAASSDDALMRWHWQSGRLVRQRNDIGKAISEYETASYYMRKSLENNDDDCSGSIYSLRNLSSRFYLELTNLLLKKASGIKDENERQKVLGQAVKSTELYKNAELQDYFKDECVTALESKIEGVDNISDDAAVLYPIVLSDRIELIMSCKGRFLQHTVPVDSATLSENIRNYRLRLENPYNPLYSRDSERIYRWIIAPVEKKLAEANIKTLIIVPDGSIRTIPVSSLFDGNKFLIQKYRAVTTPGLNLTDPSALDKSKINVLIAALSEKTAGFAALPGVKSEVEHISENFDSRILINRDFTTSEIENALTKNQYSVVHIATHGQFDTDPEKTFILTHDGKLSLNDLDRLIKPSRYSSKPVQLLALSACQTAAGDEKAALGLAGIALKSGARCAVATLWSVDDEAASRLVSYFYDELKKPGTTKAEALMTAQNRMISEREFSHPAYWSPFILIGNWL